MRRCTMCSKIGSGERECVPSASIPVSLEHILLVVFIQTLIVTWITDFKLSKVVMITTFTAIYTAIK